MLMPCQHFRLVCLFSLTSREKRADPVHKMQIGGPCQGWEHAICPWRHALVIWRAGQIAPIENKEERALGRRVEEKRTAGGMKRKS
jgi:hypothetical protein